LHRQVLTDLLACLVAILESDEGVDSLTGELVGDTDDSGLGDGS
jgi:hypothetical protein